MEEQHSTNEYRTGTTRPKEKHTGPIAALFVCVIFLGGLLSVLGLLNIHLSGDDTPPISFSKGESDGFTTQETAEAALLPLGFSCQTMAMTYQSLHNLPAGLFINHVEPDSTAASLGIVPGDVLISFDDMPVTHLELLNQLLANCPKNHRATLVIHRQDGPTTLVITLGED